MSVSFCINTARNELDYIKLLFRSIQQNFSRLDYEIIVFIDSDNQNTFEWLLTIKDIFPKLKVLKNKLPICYGYARNINEMFLVASGDIVSYLQSDMVVCRNYDLEIVKHLEKNMILCSTRIEPPLHGESSEKLTKGFGLYPNEFNMKSFIEYSDKAKVSKLTEYFFAPFTLYKEVWNSIGGHDTLFRRSREDSDILTRLVLNDVIIRQSWEALVYHFTCTSSRGVGWFDVNNVESQAKASVQKQADQVELDRFVRKWGRFNHSTNKIAVYDIVAKITDDNINKYVFSIIEKFFRRVYIKNTTIRDYYINFNKDSHRYANNLLNIDTNVWEDYNYLYRREDILNKILPYDECDGDVIVEFSSNNITINSINEVIKYLQDIVGQVSGLGVYELYPIKVHVNALKDISSSLIFVENPSVKEEDLYEIY